MADTPDTAPPANPLSALTAQARNQLATIAKTPFSQEGFAALQERIEQYVSDLILESVRIMKRRQADTVSPTYVQQASDNLVASSRRRMFTLIGTVGGVLLGAGISSYADMAKRATASVPEVLFASAMAVIGAFMIALQFTKE